ncbi:hypothetical protein VB773_04135 [Haloarculaceae archaeon H-GB2-1]|nr:hypothetical protein [Haloarculaceae archaeon H-GB1-1]MEA5388790.1 hypothetical protein [Haloarculaceae archaeon H-GB11]MEA5406846.1 hypothetical protein [Haloarculaceae archaeon H-GB2-1]
MVKKGDRFRHADGTLVEVVSVAGIEIECEVVASPDGSLSEGVRFGVTSGELDGDYEPADDVTAADAESRDANGTDSVPPA